MRITNEQIVEFISSKAGFQLRHRHIALVVVGKTLSFIIQNTIRTAQMVGNSAHKIVAQSQLMVFRYIEIQSSKRFCIV